MNNQQLLLLCERFQLGAALGELQSIAGGRQHRLWRLRTSQGDFAIKQLAPQAIRQPGARQTLRLTEQIAAAMAAAGVPAIAALTYRKRALQKIGNISLLVFPWIEGTTLPPGAASAEQARLIGALLGRMHALNLTIPGLEPPAWRVLRDDDWVLLVRRARRQRIPWAEEAQTALPELRWWSKLARDANARLWNRLVVSHRNLEQSNVVWRDASTPVLIDWESAGLMNPTLELAEAGLHWSGYTVNTFNEASFAAMLAGYRSAGGALQDGPHDALYGCMGRWLEWLELHMRRSVAGSAGSPEEEDMVWSEVDGTLKVLYRLAEDMGQMAGWMGNKAT